MHCDAIQAVRYIIPIKRRTSESTLIVKTLSLPKCREGTGDISELLMTLVKTWPFSLNPLFC